MTLTRLLISLFELALMIVMSGVVITLIFRFFLKATPDINIEAELRKGNVAIGILTATVMLSVALLLQKGLGASVSTFRLAMATPDEMAIPLWLAGLLILGHLILSLALAIVTVTVTLRLVGKLFRRINPEMPYRQLLMSGNIAIGLLLSSIVLITTLYVGDGLSAVTKALVPQPKIGTIQIMK
jgi:hypothetical protein